MDLDEEVDFGLSSWGLQSSSGFNSWTLTSWRSVGTSANFLERTFRSLGGREYFAHRNEVILRCGEMASGLHFILDGTLQVLALGEVEKRKGEPWAVLKVGELQEGQMVALPWLEKRPSRFSFRVQSKSLTAIMLTGAEITAKTESYFSQRLAREERRREEAWESMALQRFEERQREQQELEEQLEAKIDFRGLKTRDGYVIPAECLMACHPNLRQLAQKRDPPPPVAVKSLPEIQREKRFAQMDESLRPTGKPKEKELDISTLLSMDGGHGGKLNPMYAKYATLMNNKGSGNVFHPKTSENANKWLKSEAYRFCQHYPVWQPELTEDDRRQGEKAEAEENALIAERNLRMSMCRMIGVLMQVKKVIKSGVGQLRGSRIRDADDLLMAMSPNAEKIQRGDVADAIVDLGVASDEQVEELVAQMDTENTGQIDREELLDALTSPKSSVKQIYRKLRNGIATEVGDSLFSSDAGDGSEREPTLFESSEEADERPLMEALSPRSMSLALPEQTPDYDVAYNAMPSRPLSAPIRGKVIQRPLTPKPVGKFHAMQCRLRRRQLRKALRVHNVHCAALMETDTNCGDPENAELHDVQEKSSRWPLSTSESTEPRTQKLRRRLV